MEAHEVVKNAEEVGSVEDEQVLEYIFYIRRSASKKSTHIDNIDLMKMYLLYHPQFQKTLKCIQICSVNFVKGSKLPAL